MLPFSNDAGYTQAAEHLGREIFGERFFMEGEDELFLSGDNAYRYFQKVPGIFLVFLAAPEHANPLHHPKFQLDEEDAAALQCGDALPFAETNAGIQMIVKFL